MNKIKVFHVITMLELGGAQGNTLYTVKNLDRNIFDASLACGEGGILDAQAAEAGRPVYFLKHLKREINPVWDFLAFLELFKLFKRHRPDIVHTHSSKAGILGRLAAKAAGVPAIIHSFHGFGFNKQQSRLVRKAFIASEKLCAPLADALIFVSAANQKEAAELGIISPKGRQLIIRSGIELSRYPAHADRPAKRREFGVPPDAQLVVTVGNLKPQKNPLDFVAAAALVLKTNPGAFFLYIGDGPLRGEAESLANRLGVSGRCAFPGWRHDTPEILAAADVFVLTSLWEGLPRSLVEALKTGLPCAAYATDGVNDILDGNNGFMIPQKDVKTLAEKVSALLSDSALRARVAKNAAATALAEFDISAMVKSQEALYTELSKGAAR